MIRSKSRQQYRNSNISAACFIVLKQWKTAGTKSSEQSDGGSDTMLILAGKSRARGTQ